MPTLNKQVKVIYNNNNNNKTLDVYNLFSPTRILQAQIYLNWLQLLKKNMIFAGFFCVDLHKAMVAKV